jgi:hypothetical protein
MRVFLCRENVFFSRGIMLPTLRISPQIFMFRAYHRVRKLCKGAQEDIEKATENKV